MASVETLSQIGAFGLFIVGIVVLIAAGCWAWRHMTSQERFNMSKTVATLILQGQYQQVPKELVDNIIRELTEQSPTKTTPPLLTAPPPVPPIYLKNKSEADEPGASRKPVN